MSPLSSVRYYRHSGRFSARGLVQGAIVALAIGAMAAVLYAYADEYVPSVKLAFVLCLLFGGVVGVTTAAAMQRGNVRNTAITVAVTLFVATFAYCVSWPVWLYAMLHRNAPDLHLNPAQLFLRPGMTARLIGQVNEVGAWRMSSADTEPVRGPFLTVIWISEALGIVGFAAVVAVGRAKRLPFCEGCERWCGPPALVRTTGLAGRAELKRELEAGNFSVLNTLGPAVPSSGRWLTFEHQACNCGRLQTLTVRAFAASRDRKGRVTRQRVTSTIAKQLLLAPGSIEHIRAQA